MVLNTFKGNIRKMQTDFQKKIQYFFKIDQSLIHLNLLLDKNISILYNKKINCINCDKLTKKSYSQGYCYQCFISLPDTDISIVQPEKDLSHLGISRNMEWAKRNSLKPHYVYLAFTSDYKIGVTREKNIPERWIDQGAISAMKIAKTPNRHIAGVIEVYLKKYFKDKTNWSKMLTIKENHLDISTEKEKVISLLHPELKQYIVSEEKVYKFNYPINSLSIKYSQIQLEKANVIDAKLKGIKGQYLIFENGNVLNVRRHAGYEIIFTHPYVSSSSPH